MENAVNARSWFCVFNNPENHGFSGSPEEIAEQMKDRWIAGNPQRTCAVAYCISADGLHHCHAVFEDTKTMRFTVVQKLFPGMHIIAFVPLIRQRKEVLLSIGMSVSPVQEKAILW